MNRGLRARLQKYVGSHPAQKLNIIIGTEADAETFTCSKAALLTLLRNVQMPKRYRPTDKCWACEGLRDFPNLVAGVGEYVVERCDASIHQRKRRK